MSCDTPLSDFYTVDELAIELGIHRRTLDKYRAMKIGPPYGLIFGRVRYPLDGVQKWIAEQVSASESGL